MKERFRDLPITIEEVRRMMKKEESKRATCVAIGIGVVAILVGIIIWVAKRREKDLNEHYEYFDEDFDELDEDFEEFDDSIYDDNETEIDEEEPIEYVKINDFMNDDVKEKEVVAKENAAESKELATEEKTEEKIEEK